MVVVREARTIRTLLSQVCNVVYDVAVEVESYKQVVASWVKYKNTKSSYLRKDEDLISDIFKFHRIEKDHIVLYYSRNKPECLLMCRVGGKYINVLAPAAGIDHLGRNIIAVYC